jgi:hypothetical protein
MFVVNNHTHIAYLYIFHTRIQDTGINLYFVISFIFYQISKPSINNNVILMLLLGVLDTHLYDKFSQ